MFKFIPLLFAALFFGVIRADKPIDCRDVLAKPGSAQLCQITWKKLQKNIYPTQAEVGYAWVASKLKGWDSVKDAQQNMDEKPTPVVIGREPGGNDLAFYLVDDHHTLSALDYADFKDDVVVTVKVLCDLSHLDPQSFWEYLSNHGFAYLAKSIHHNLPEPIPYTMMPTEFRFQKNSKAFADSAWRSLVSFSRKLKDNNRCMWRSCTPQGGSVFFFEFRWGYFLQDVTFPPPDPSNSYWPDAQSRNEFATFLDKVVAEPIDNLKKDVDLKEWSELASKIFPLCRAEKINNYLLPAWFDGSSGTRSHLPGIWTKNDPVPKDPKCHGSTCVAPALQASKTHTEF